MKLHLTDDTMRALKRPEGQAQLVVFDTKLPGFGIVVGRTASTFIVNRRVGKKLHREAIGRYPDIDARSARKQAIVMLGKLENKEATPNKVKRARATGPTLAEACDLYTESLRTSGSRPSSIATVQREIGRDPDHEDGDKERSYLASWLDRSLASISGKECRARHGQIVADHGPHVANRVMRQLRAIWNHVAKEASAGTIDGLAEGTVFAANPTIAVEWITEKNSGAVSYIQSRGEPVPWARLPAWYTAVMAMESRDGFEGVRRDYNLVVILTGLRRRDAASLRWDLINMTDERVTTRMWHASKKAWAEIELPARSMLRPSPKGGPSRSFFVPLSGSIIEVLERRRAANSAATRSIRNEETGEKVVVPLDDGGWVFPARAIKDCADRKQPCYSCVDLGMPPHVAGQVSHISEPKEESDVLVSPHRLRDTYTTALADLKHPPLSPFVIDVLTNHRSPRGSVTAGYVGELDLVECQERVSAYIVERFKDRPEPAKARSRGALYAVK